MCLASVGLVTQGYQRDNQTHSLDRPVYKTVNIGIMRASADKIWKVLVKHLEFEDGYWPSILSGDPMSIPGWHGAGTRVRAEYSEFRLSASDNSISSSGSSSVQPPARAENFSRVFVAALNFNTESGKYSGFSELTVAMLWCLSEIGPKVGRRTEFEWSVLTENSQ